MSWLSDMFKKPKPPPAPPPPPPPHLRTWLAGSALGSFVLTLWILRGKR